MRRILAAVLLAGAVSAVPAQAQDAGSETDRVQRSMRATLRCLASSQEIHYARERTYSSDVAALKVIGAGCLPEDYVAVTVPHADTTAFAMAVTHTLLPGQSCGMLFGRSDGLELFTQAKKYPVHQFPGRAICDFDPPPGKARP